MMSFSTRFIIFCALFGFCNTLVLLSADDRAESITPVDPRLEAITDRWKDQRDQIRTATINLRLVRTIPSLMSIHTRDELLACLDIIEPQCNEDEFELLCRSVLREEADFKSPYADVRLVIDGEKLREQLTVERPSGGSLTTDRVIRDGVDALVSTDQEHSQLTLADSKSRRLPTALTLNSIRFIPMPDIEGSEVSDLPFDRLGITKRSGRFTVSIAVSQVSGFVHSWVVADQEGRHVKEVRQYHPHEYPSKLMLPTVLVTATYGLKDEIMGLDISFIRSAELNAVIPSAEFEMPVKKGTPVLDARDPSANKAVVLPANVRNIAETLNVIDPKTPEPREVSNGRMILIWINLFVIFVLAAIFWRQRKRQQ